MYEASCACVGAPVIAPNWLIACPVVPKPVPIVPKPAVSACSVSAKNGA